MLRFAAPRIAAALMICSFGLPQTVAAQTDRESPLRQALDTAVQVPTLAGPTPVVGLKTQERRPSALLPLYVTFATLQILDTHSTARAVGRGAVEANPVMKGFAGNEVGMLAVKAAGTAGVIVASEKMWKKNRKAAVIFMLAANSAMTWVVHNNYRAVR